MPRVGHLSNLEHRRTFERAQPVLAAAFDDDRPRGIRLADGSPSLPTLLCWPVASASRRCIAQPPPAPAATRSTGRSTRSSTSTCAMARLLPRAAVVARRARSICRVAQRADGDLHRVVARSQDGVLGERLQRHRAPDHRQPISDRRHEQRVPGIEHPADSGRVRPGEAPAAGRSVTLDEIEKTVLAEFNEPRLSLALGRGAVGSGRLRSEAYTGGAFARAARRHPGRVRHQAAAAQGRSGGGQVSMTAIVSWHEAEFVAAYGGQAGERSPRARRSNGRSSLHHAAPAPAREEFVDETIQGDVPGVRLAAQPFDGRADRVGGSGSG